MMMKIYRASVFCLTLLFPAALGAQVSSERLLRAAEEPQNWLTYSALT